MRYGGKRGTLEYRTMTDDDATLKAIGQFALNFSNVDYTVTYFAKVLLDCRDLTIRRHIIEPLTFGSKLDQLSWLVEHHAKKHGIEQRPLVKELRVAISETKALAANRNDVFHGVVLVTPEKQGFAFCNELKGRRVEGEQLDALGREAERLFRELSRLLYEFNAMTAKQQAGTERGSTNSDE